MFRSRCLLFAAAACACAAAASVADVLAASDDAACAAALASLPAASFDEATGTALMSYTMSRSWWKCAWDVFQQAQTHRVDMTTTISQTASSMRKELDKLVDATQKRAVGARGIAPAFEWAQSPDSLFLNVKFAHKLDTPATLGCESEGLQVSGKHLQFKAQCKKGKEFHLSLHLLNDVDSSNSTWSMSSVGRAMVTLRKATNGTWPRLLANPQKLPNMHIWWAMREKYTTENEEFAKQQASGSKAAPTAAAPTAAAADAPSSDASQAVPPPPASLPAKLDL